MEPQPPPSTSLGFSRGSSDATTAFQDCPRRLENGTLSKVHPNEALPQQVQSLADGGYNVDNGDELGPPPTDTSADIDNGSGEHGASWSFSKLITTWNMVYFLAFLTNGAVFGIVIFAVHIIDSDLGKTRDPHFNIEYSRFRPTKYMLFATIWSIGALSFSFALDKKPRLVRLLTDEFKYREHTVNNVLALIFWLAGAIAQAVNISNIVYCGKLECGSLEPPYRAMIWALTLLAFGMTVLWAALSIRAIQTSLREYRNQRHQVRGVHISDTRDEGSMGNDI